jgi:enoyl-CoA hydratase/3-hydroxyacyl-CoA dehydrogenase
MDANTANDLGLVSHLVEPTEVDNTILQISSQGKPENKYPGKPKNANSKVAIFANEFYSDENIPILLAGKCPDGYDLEDRNIGRQIKSLSRAAPLALQMANELIDYASNSDLASGLEMELEKLEGIFSTADSLEGLSALIEGRKPKYQGK